jgi:hypothetical protein
MKTQTITAKLHIRKHPREYLYQGIDGNEHYNAGMSFFMNCSPKELAAFNEGRIPETMMDQKEKYQLLYQTILVNDVIGYNADMFKVIDKKDDLVLHLENTKTKKTEMLEYGLDVVLSMKKGFLEILYRDDKPFGLPTEREIQLTIKGNK